MASFRLSIVPLSAGQGRSPQAASAYILGAKSDEISSLQASNAYISGISLGEFDYTQKRGILHTEFIGPVSYRLDHLKPDRVRFWADVVDFEKRNNRRFYSRKTGKPVGTLAREHKVNLPSELELESNIKLARAYCLEVRRRFGIAGEFAVHAPSRRGDQRNIHFHFLHTDRGLSDACKFANSKSELSRGNRSQHLKDLRKWWADRVNRELEKEGISSRVDHRSLENQGIERLPTKHMGPRITKLERAGIPTWIGEYNRAVTRFYEENNRKPNHDELTKIRRRATIARGYGERKLDATKSSHRYRRTIDRIGEIRAIFADIRFPIPITRQRHRQSIQKVIEAAEAIGRLCFSIASTYSSSRLRTQGVKGGFWLPRPELSDVALGHFRSLVLKNKVPPPQKRNIRKLKI